MVQKFDQDILKNGMVLLGEPMEGVQSAAFRFMLPVGAAVPAEGVCGAVNVISDWIFRGAGDKDSRKLSDALDGLGLHRASSVNSSHLTIGAALEAGNLEEALDLYGSFRLSSIVERLRKQGREIKTERIGEEGYARYSLEPKEALW